MFFCSVCLTVEGILSHRDSARTAHKYCVRHLWDLPGRQVLFVFLCVKMCVCVIHQPPLHNLSAFVSD